MTPLEEQVEKLARELNLEAGRQRGWTDVDDWEYITEQERGGWRNMAKTAIAALLPLEVTDESPLRVTVDTADLIELLYGATTDSPANRKARTRLRAALTQPQTEKLGSCVEHGTWDIYECEDGRCPQCGDKLVPGPFPYAKAFRERVCPVPEFPGIKNRQEDQA